MTIKTVAILSPGEILLSCIKTHQSEPWLDVLGIDASCFLQVTFGQIHLSLPAVDPGQTDVCPGLFGIAYHYK